MAASNTRFTQNSLGQSKNPIDSDHGIYRDYIALAHSRYWQIVLQNDFAHPSAQD